MFLASVFYGFAIILVFSALKVVTARNTVHSAMFLVLAFFTTSALWILLHAEFLAIALVLVYVGAVMVLFLFVVMMLNLNMAPLREGFVRYAPLGILIGLVIIAEMVIVITKGFGFGAAKTAAGASAAGGTVLSNTRELGKVLYTDYLFHFELAAAVLLLAIIAAIVLTLHQIAGTKHQNPGKQVQVRKGDRLRVVKMDAEKADNT